MCWCMVIHFLIFPFISVIPCTASHAIRLFHITNSLGGGGGSKKPEKHKDRSARKPNIATSGSTKGRLLKAFALIGCFFQKVERPLTHYAIVWTDCCYNSTI